ncbi:MAG TPA: hypothetical protein VMY69_07135 [Phycisphaerae bacterium]|nr:hypothetical protein [Phycisphaerae bacterium]
MTEGPHSKAVGQPPKARREVQELSLLLEISQTLEQSLDLREVVGPVLEAMAKHMGMVRGTLALLNRQTGEIFIEAAVGLSPKQRQRGRYKLGEGVTGKVVETGRPAASRCTRTAPRRSASSSAVRTHRATDT